MIYYFFESYFQWGGLMIRIAGAAVVSFLVVLIFGPRVIRFLIRSRLGDRTDFDNADLNELGRHKSETPTMGGVLIIAAIIVALLLFANLANLYIRMALLATVWLGVLGGIDDWIKLRYAARKGERQGLYAWEKLLFQVGLAVLLSIFMYRYSSQSFVGAVNPAHQFHFPLPISSIYLPLAAHVIITVLTMVGSSNAVNLTDGMDGLAAGCMTIVCGFFLIISWVVGVQVWADQFNMPFVTGSAEMTVLCGAMLGGCLGFLWYNSNPAQVFMGDTGSLPLGGLIGYIAVVTRQELLLMIAGGVFVIEAVSVMMQVGYYKLTKGPGSAPGKRIFRCAPVHHHFHLGGWQENKVVVRFWILCILFAAMALATLKLR